MMKPEVEHLLDSEDVKGDKFTKLEEEENPNDSRVDSLLDLDSKDV